MINICLLNRFLLCCFLFSVLRLNNVLKDHRRAGVVALGIRASVAAKKVELSVVMELIAQLANVRAAVSLRAC